MRADSLELSLSSPTFSQTFWVVVRSLLSSSYEFFHRRLLLRFLPGKEKSVTFIISLLLCFFHFQINWFRSFDDKRNSFYPIFNLCISFVGIFVSVRSTHGASLKTNLIGLLPIQSVKVWIFCHGSWNNHYSMTFLLVTILFYHEFS